MNDILFYTLILIVIYFVFFHKSVIEKFNNQVKSKKECSQDAINDGILNYMFGGSYVR